MPEVFRWVMTCFKAFSKLGSIQPRILRDLLLCFAVHKVAHSFGDERGSRCVEKRVAHGVSSPVFLYRIAITRDFVRRVGTGGVCLGRSKS